MRKKHPTEQTTLRNEARSAETPAARLHELYDMGILCLRLALCKNPNCDEALLEKLVKRYPDRAFRNPAFKMLLFTRGISWISSDALVDASHNSCSPSLLDWISNHTGPLTLSNIAQNEHASGQSLHRVAETLLSQQGPGAHFGVNDGLKAICKHKNVLSRTLVMIADGCPSTEIRAEAIEHRKFPRDSLEKWGKHARDCDDVKLMRAVISNPRCHHSILDDIARKYIDDVAAQASPLVVFLLGSCAEHPRLHPELLSRFATKPFTSWVIGVASNPSTPMHVQARLVRHHEPMVRAALASRKDLSEILLAELSKDSDKSVQDALSKKSRLFKS